MGLEAGLVKAGKQAIEVLLKLKGDDLVLTAEKGTEVEQPSGGSHFVPAAPLAPQRFALRSNSGESDGITESESGIVTQKFPYILTGRWNCNVPVPSYWVSGSNRYRVERELVRNEYCRKFGVTSSGPRPVYG